MGGVCLQIDPDDELFGACFGRCANGEECPAGSDCAPILNNGASICFQGCSDNEDCHTSLGETCVGAVAGDPASGTCQGPGGPDMGVDMGEPDMGS